MKLRALAVVSLALSSLAPADPERASGTALLEISNRGGLATLAYFQGGRYSSDPRTAEDFGDGLLMRMGTTLIWVGWQFDVPADRSLRLQVPRISDPRVSGLGLAAIRDTISYAKYDQRCRFRVQRGIALGISQTGRFLRHFLYQGFTATSRGAGPSTAC